FALFYAILRAAGASAIVRVGAVLLGVSASVLEKAGGTTIIPNRSLRFVLPFAAILFVVLAERSRAHRAAWSYAIAALVALSSVWAAETFVYTAAAPLAAAAFEAAAPLRRRRDALRLPVAIAVATVAAQLAFNVGTRIASGRWPDWPYYFTYLHSFAA